MNVVKNWALAIMLIALAFAHFSSELLLKEQMIISVKKTLNNAGHINAKLIDFSERFQKNPARSAVFYWLFLAEVSPRNLEWNRPIFLRIRPWKSSQIWLFFAEILRNRPIFPRIWPWKSREILLFFPRNIRSPDKVVQALFPSSLSWGWVKRCSST